MPRRSPIPLPLRAANAISLGALAVLLPAALAPAALALDFSVPAIGGDQSRSLLGGGAGVIVGVVDSGVDDLHPTLAGLDPMGMPRLVAEANFVPEEPANTGDDEVNHGTGVAGVLLGSDPAYTGLAPDARYVNARVLDSSNQFADDARLLNGVGFALGHGADVLNLSLNYTATLNGGSTPLELMLDWAAAELGVSTAICAGNTSAGRPTIRGPGGAFNGMTVGRTDLDFDQVHPESATAFTQNNRMKPDIVAPGTSITTASSSWENELDFVPLSGCSYSAPHVAGLMAQQIGAGRDLGLSTNPLVIKATMMNSASKDVLDKDGNPWSASSLTQPLDTHAGAGQADGRALARQYLAGEQGPGLVDAVGWDLMTVTEGGFVDYTIDSPLELGSMLTATLTWFRKVSRVDGGVMGVIDSGDSFQAEALDNLDLHLLADGVMVGRSVSFFDNVEHLWLPIADPAASYTVRVVGTSLAGPGLDELFAVAWSAVAVPEPGTLALGLIVAPFLLSRNLLVGGLSEADSA